MVEYKKFYIDNSNIKQYMSEIKKYELLTHEGEINLAKKIEKGDTAAFEKLVKSNLRLVVSIAKKYETPEWQLADLIQEGNIGLIKTAKKFDYRKNVRFSTYASWWIKQSIARSMSNKRRMIRLPHRKEEILRKINKTTDELSQRLNRSPSVIEVAEQLNYNTKDIINLRNMSEKVVSLYSENNENDGYYFINILNDMKYSPESIYEQKNLKNETNEILKKLKDKEREVIKSRFAFEHSKRKTLQSIAKELGISPETVRQIEKKAIKKIKDNYSYLKDFLI